MAITQALGDGIRRELPAATIELRTHQHEAAPRYYPDECWKPSLGQLIEPRWRIPKTRRLQLRVAEAVQRRRVHGALRNHVADFAQYDVVVTTGGTYLVEQYELRMKFFEWKVASQLGIPVLFYTQSLGPFRRRRNKANVRRLVGSSPLVLLRDERSRAHLEDIGVHLRNVHVAADPVFAWAPADVAFGIPPPGEPLKIGMSVRQWPVGATLDSPPVERFARSVADAVTRLVRELSAEVLFISTCQGAPEYWIDDSELAMRILDLLPVDVQDGVRVDTNFHTPQEFRAMVGQLDLMIATRLHAAILSLTAGTPVLPIAYEFKTRELFNSLGMADMVLDIENITGEHIYTGVQSLQVAGDRRLAPLGPRIVEQRGSALTAEALLADRVRALV